MSKSEFLIVLLMGLIFSASPVLASVNITSCGVLDSAGGGYNMTSNIASSTSGNCLAVTNANIVLDCGYYGLQGNYTGNGIYIASNATGTHVLNCIIFNWQNGVYVDTSNSNLIENIQSNYNSRGVMIHSSDCVNGKYNIIQNSNLDNNYYGADTDCGQFNTFDTLSLSDIQVGIAVGTSDILRNSRITGNSNVGISAYDNGTFYNNFLNNSLDADVSGLHNTWDYGGRGNYWGFPNGTGFSDTCVDSGHDGICDTAYTLNVNNVDHFPLSVYSITPSVAQITSYTIPTTAYLDGVYDIRVWIKNTGQIQKTFYVGLSIGDIYPAGKVCDKDCYQDGLGDYAQVTLAPSQTALVTRSFKFRDDYFTNGQQADVLLDVFDAPYLPPQYALNRVNLTNYITISQPAPFAYAQNCVASKDVTSRKDTIRIDCYVNNNGTMTWNFTLGMSIGIWSSAPNGQILNYIPPWSLTPCNTGCYRDGLGAWVYAEIPPNYTDPYERSFYIPDYFLLNNSFDVESDIWTAPPDHGGRLISYVVIKNISYVSDIPSDLAVYGQAGKEAVSGAVSFFGDTFSTDITGAKFVFWTVITAVISVLAGYALREKGGGAIGSGIFILMIILGVVLKGVDGVSFIPSWVGVILVIISGGVFAGFMGKLFGGGG
jgi:hypothetical protein